MVIIQYKGHELKILPERGAIISYWKYKGEHVLYEDPNLHVNRIIRGGMPVLFPICGELENDSASFNGKPYKITRHGFARDCRWKLIKLEEDCIQLQFQSNSQTLDQYPYHFNLDLEYKLKADGLTVQCHVENWNKDEMPYQLGFHPYFLIENKADSSHTYKWNEEVNDCILEKPSIRLNRKSFTIDVILEEQFDRFVVWSLPNSPFICLEPWNGGCNSLNNIKWYHLKAMQSKTHTFSINIIKN